MHKKLLSFLPIILVVILAFAILSLRSYYIFAQKVLGISPIIFLLKNGDFKKTDNKVNFLFLGKAGGLYNGPELTDSITVISLNLKTNTITSISIPRDIWSATLRDRINSAYAYGEAIQKGGGFRLSKAEISAIVGVPIHFAYLIDFEKFKELIDYLGGVDVFVERSFDDYKFPIPGRENDLCGKDPSETSDEAYYDCRYEHISFKKGWEHMDGSLALKFVRSRHAEGEEGSDYARGQRQQNIMNAIYDKMLSRLRNFNVGDLEKMYILVDNLVDRDIKNLEALYIAKKFFFAKSKKINQVALSRDFFIVPDASNYDGKYVLIPPDEDYELIHKYVDCQIEGNTNCDSIKPRLEE